MDVSSLYGIAQNVLKTLGSIPFEEIASVWCFETELNKLKNIINTLKDKILNAEERQADIHVHSWLERLTTVVYAADDLFDEFNTVAERKELMNGHKVIMEVCTFCSPDNQVLLALKIYWNIKKIREKLDDIEKEGNMFEFLCGSPIVMSRRHQTLSHVAEAQVIGRDSDKTAILKMLLESSSTGHEELPVFSIVGMGGMGKTTLAQLIYNDLQVKKYFDLRLWVCVSDVFENKVIIEKLLKSATLKDHPNLDIEQLHGLLRNEMAGKKCLLVLDDVWNEDRRKWVDLKNLLNIGRKGSKILVTTRLVEVAKIMGTSPHDLKELSKEESWKLFEKMAFENHEEAQQKPRLVEIGKEIIKKCRDVPLAIKTLGGLLYGKEEREWLYVKNTSLAKITDNEGGIMDILKLSYHHLSSPLKNCFAYCALFPKDYEFQMEMLTDLWIAEGFIVQPSNDDQSLDKVAEDYFHILLQRGFFQDIQRNSLEVITTCKMHDLMHDLAQVVAGVKCKVVKSNERNFDEKNVHLSLAYELTPSREIPNSMLNMKLLRTFLLPEQKRHWSLSSKSISLLTRFGSLRVLDLHGLGLQSLPRSIGKLIHLRYLNLSRARIEKLPDSVTDLWNLQTLRLDWSRELKTLPANMRKLTNLRCLDVVGCDKLSHMPSGLGGLTLLNKLPVFIVGAADERYKSTAKLSDLKNLNNLRGVLEIDIRCKSSEISMLEAREAELSNKHGLTELEISFPEIDECDCKHDEAVLEGLEPPPEIKSLIINDYRGENVPSWARMNKLCTTLPYLVEISLWGWNRCQQLPAFSQLPFLKRLELVDLESVEYIESDDACGVPSSTSSSRPAIVFPSLEELCLINMENLKGWWKEVEAIENENGTLKRASNELAAQQMPRIFSKLSYLYIGDCPKLRMLPPCPNVEHLSLSGTNEILSEASSTSSSSAPFYSSGFNLKRLFIQWDDKLESTERLVGVFATLSSLQHLQFWDCKKLRSIAKGLEHLTNLEDLEIDVCENVDVWEDEEGTPWKAFNTTLRSLTLSRLPQLVGLPTGLQHLSNLRSLSLRGNRELEELPEWMSCLSSLEYLELSICPKLKCLPEAFRQLTTLNHLKIIDCPGLKARCQEGPNGSEWPKIQHIPHRLFRDH